MRRDNAPDYFWSDISINFLMQFSVWLAPENDCSVSRMNLSRNFWLCWVNLLFKIFLTQYFPSCIICSVHRLRESLHEVSWLKEGKRGALKKWEHFTILIGWDQKSKTSYFPLYLSNMTGRFIWSESIWTGGLLEYFPGLTWMYGESNEKPRRWPWNTIDYLKHRFKK